MRALGAVYLTLLTAAAATVAMDRQLLAADSGSALGAPLAAGGGGVAIDGEPPGSHARRLQRTARRARYRRLERLRKRCVETPEDSISRLTCGVTVSSGSGCREGGLLFETDFESETVGSPPTASPLGLPVDDRLRVSGDFVIVRSPSGASQGAQPLRTADTVRLEALPGFGTDLARSYCASFTLEMTADPRGPLTVALEARDRTRAWLLEIAGGEATVTSGTGTHALAGSYEPGDVHRFRFEVDVARGTFDLILDDVPLESELELLNADFEAPERLAFEYTPTLLDGLPGGVVVDDVAIRKTSELDATVIVLVRHAERATTDTNSNLVQDPTGAPLGVGRAELLADTLASTRIAAAYSTEFCRTAQTAQPTARRSNLTLQVVPSVFSSSSLESCDPPISVPVELLPTRIQTSREVAAQLLDAHAGEVALFAGHSGTLPELIENLGAPSVCPGVLPFNAGICRIPGDEYHHLFTVIVPDDGSPASFRHTTYGPP